MLTVIKLAGERIGAIFELHEPTTKKSMSTSPFPLKPQQARTGQLKKQWKANPISQKTSRSRKKKKTKNYGCIGTGKLEINWEEW